MRKCKSNLLRSFDLDRERSRCRELPPLSAEEFCRTTSEETEHTHAEITYERTKDTKIREPNKKLDERAKYILMSKQTYNYMMKGISQTPNDVTADGYFRK